ncbi:MAG: glycosyltransferase family 4 protein [Ktedonobacteraceae bacterium]|nr:glycosyltransferase family 4 protein [Ktedonobacteraceae bacterium]MBO0791021.1 glycosyltransferase family 4 protein [Ktedonobacteraceae bacterium]
MHIGINAQLLSFSQNYRNGGVSRYIRYLLSELAQQPGSHEYTVFVNGQDVIDRLPRHPQITYVAAPWPEARPAARVMWEQLNLPTQLRQRQIAVLHSPVNVLPERLPGECASVVTLHDLAFLRFPHVLTRAKRLYHRTFTVRSLRRATMLITVSQSTKQDAHELVGVPLEGMQTVYPCIDERFSQVVEEQVIQDFRRQKELTDGFFLYLSTLEPRKNVTTLIDAYKLLRERYGVREKLVLAGGKGWLYDEIFARVQRLDLGEHVIFAGFVADAEQALWYRAASAFVYPSLYEGFGIPVAEALACGTPTVTSNISSLPEAGAQIALCVDPHNVEALAEAMRQAITDDHLREKCRLMSSTVAQLFSARTMVQQTLAVYEQAAIRHASRSRVQHRASVVR